VMDFGVLRLMDVSVELTKTGTIYGTAAYISPEQAMGIRVDHRADLYSLGVILYEALTGRRPFETDKLISILLQHLNDEPTPIFTYNPLIPPDLANIVNTLLRKNPDERYQSAEAVEADLKKVVHNLRTSSGVSGVLNLVPDSLIQVYDASDYLHTPHFIGRKDEMSRYQQVLPGFSLGRGAFWLIRGEDGMGKTSFLRQMLQDAKSKNILCFSGSGKALNNEYLGVFSSILGDMADYIYEDESLKAVEIIPENSRFLKAISSKFDRPVWNESLLTGGSTLQNRDKKSVFAAILRLFVNLAAKRPFLVFLDEIEQMDTHVLEFLSYLVNNGIYRYGASSGRTHTPILLVATFSENFSLRPDLRKWLNGMIRNRAVQGIRLTRFSREETAEMIQALMQNENLPEFLVDFIYQESLGNPRYIIEYMKLMLVAKVLLRQDRKWKVNRDIRKLAFPMIIREFDDTSVITPPRDLVKSLERRFASLEDEERNSLFYMAVLGDSFHFDWVLALMKVDEEELLDCVENLLKKQILEEDKSNDDFFFFPQRQLRNVILDLIAPEKREQMLQKTVVLFENMGKIPGEDYYVRLAYYAKMAGMAEVAIKYGLVAAAGFKERHQHHKALHYYQIIERNLKTQVQGTHYKQHFETLFKQSEIYGALADYRKTIKCHQQLQALAEAQNDKVGLANVLFYIALTYLAMSLFQKAVSCQKKSLALARELRTSGMLLKNFISAAKIFNELGNSKVAMQYLKKGESLVNVKTPAQLGALYRNTLAEVFLAEGNYQEGQKLFESVKKTGEQLKLISLQVKAHLNLASVKIRQNSLDSASVHAHDALAQAESAGFRFEEVQARILNARISFLKEDYYSTIQEAGAAIRQRGKKYSRYPIFEAYYLLGITQYKLNNLDKAFDFLNDANDIVKNTVQGLNPRHQKLFVQKKSIQELYFSMKSLMEELGLKKEAELYAAIMKGNNLS